MKVVNKKIKMIIIVILTLIEVTSVFLMYKSFNNKNPKLDSVNLINEIDKNMFAIMLEQEDGTYLETNGDWEIGNRVFDENRSGCIDVNGNKLENVLTYENDIAIVETGKTAFCYLYFSFHDEE